VTIKLTEVLRSRNDRRGWVLLGITFWKNGSWASRYSDGRRLFYIYVDVVICDRVLQLLIDFKGPVISRPEEAA